ncbi:MAG TPA: hypothetical protein ACFYD4_01815 [Candidatus Wunengus sp. YC61]|uniref:hypothetical protein n=1 Tax=Candidatus Wunengus sp. YC61 TaxID=3367698 RepID=UPI0040258480
MRLNLELEITDLPRVVKILKCRYGNTNELPQLLSMCIDEVVGVQQNDKILNQPSHEIPEELSQLLVEENIRMRSISEKELKLYGIKLLRLELINKFERANLLLSEVSSERLETLWQSFREMIDQTSVCIASLEGSLGSEGSKLE